MFYRGCFHFAFPIHRCKVLLGILVCTTILKIAVHLHGAIAIFMARSTTTFFLFLLRLP